MCPGIDLRTPETVYVIDDDPDVFTRWQKRFPGAKWVGISALPETPPPGPALYLVDDEFRGSTLRGLDWIERHALTASSFLVTHRWEEVQEPCAKRGIRLLPKSLMERVPLSP
jgi:hypothetical protein